MTDAGRTHKRNGHKVGKAASDSEARLESLLHDLDTLHDYLRERGQHTYELAQRFLANSRRDSSSRAYDERQATMLEYQQYIWHEIAGRVQQLLAAYGDEETSAQASSDTEEEHS